METINWGLVFSGIGAGATLLGANAWLMKLVIDSALSKALLKIQQDFVTRDEFNRHVDKCPLNNRSIEIHDK